MSAFDRVRFNQITKNVTAVGAVVASLAACNAGNSLPGSSSTSPSVVGAVVPGATSSPAVGASSSPGVGSTASPQPGSTAGNPGASASPGASSAPGVGATASPAPTSLPGSVSTGNSGNSGGSNNAGLTSGSAAGICYQTAPANATATILSTAGNIVGSTYTSSGATLSNWETVTYAVDGTPQPVDTSSPVVEPTPTSYITENLYTGTYAIPNGTTGCFVVIAHADLSTFYTGAGYNAVASGFVAGPDGYHPVLGAHGAITSLVVNGISGASGSGSFTLDNGQTGSIQITNFGTFQDPQYANTTLSTYLRNTQSRFSRR